MAFIKTIFLGRRIYIVMFKWHVLSSIYTLSAYIIFICASFVNRNNSEPLSSSSIMLCSEYKLILYFPTMFIYWVYSAMLKFSNNWQIVKGKKPNFVLSVCNCPFYHIHAYTVIVSYSCSTWIAYQNKNCSHPLDIVAQEFRWNFSILPRLLFKTSYTSVYPLNCFSLLK